MKTILSAALAMLMLSCGAPGKCDAPLAPGRNPASGERAAPIAPSAVTLPVTGLEFSATLFGGAPPVGTCTGVAAKVTVTTSVLDPENQPLMHQHTDPVDTASTTISFTPTVPGPYHLTARFEPNLGEPQLDLLVAVNKPNAVGTPVSVFSGKSCTFVEKLSDGTALCGVGGQRVEVYPFTGSTRQQITAVTWARVGEVLWRVETAGPQLTRYKYNPALGSYEAEKSVAVPLTVADGVTGLAATEDTVWVVNTTGGALFHVTAGVLGEGVKVEFPTGLGIQPTAVLSADGKVLGAAGAANYCQVDAALAQKPVCFIGLGVPVGLEPGVLWTWAAGSRALRRVVPGGAFDKVPAAKLLVLPFGMNATALGEGAVLTGSVVQGTFPLVTSFGFDATSYLPRLQAEGLVLDRYQDPSKGKTFSATVDTVRVAGATENDFVLLRKY